MKTLLSTQLVDFIINDKNVPVKCDGQIVWVSKTDHIAEMAVSVLSVSFFVSDGDGKFIEVLMSRDAILKLSEEINRIESVKIKPEFYDEGLPF